MQRDRDHLIHCSYTKKSHSFKVSIIKHYEHWEKINNHPELTGET